MPYTEDTGQTYDSVFVELQQTHMLANTVLKFLHQIILQMHPILLTQHLCNLLFPGEALEVQREYPLYVMGML